MYGDYYDEAADDKRAAEARKKRQAKVNQRKLIRFQELSDEEVRKQGSEVLSKMVSIIPKYFNRSGHGQYGARKEGVCFIGKKQVIRINLALRPSAVIDYVVGAFQTKGWEAKHTYDDVKDYDFLDLSLPEDWLKRVLCIGRYNVKVSEPEVAVAQPAPVPAPNDYPINQPVAAPVSEVNEDEV